MRSENCFARVVARTSGRRFGRGDGAFVVFDTIEILQ